MKLLNRSDRRSFPTTLLPPSAFPAFARKPFFSHEILHTSRKEGSRARVGRLHTPHGIVDTPGFVVVGTNGAVKFVDHFTADDAGMQLMFANTLHLLVHPGMDHLSRAGGLHKLMRRDKPLITDSGGFQIFSFANRGGLALPGRDGEGVGSHPAKLDITEDDDEVRVRGDGPDLKGSEKRRSKYIDGDDNPTAVSVSEWGATFRSYRDGATMHLSPESTIEAQKIIGADIIIPLDDLPTASIHGRTLADSVARTHRWEARSLMTHTQDPRQQAIYAVLHGGTDRDLRRQSVETLSEYPFDGYAIGGSFGRDRSEMVEMLRYLMPLVPTDKPNHLLGMGDVDSIRAGVALGIDTFDSSFPTRLGRHGTLLTREGPVKIRKVAYRDDYGPVDPRCDGFVSTRFSRAYLHHLWRANEPAVHGLLTLHNIKFMMDMMADLRGAIMRDEI